MRTDGYDFCRGESQHLTGIANRCARRLWGALRGVMIRGHCEIFEDEVSVRVAFEARAGAQARASPIQPGAVASAPKREVLKVRPEKVVRRDHRKLGGRY